MLTANTNFIKIKSIIYPFKNNFSCLNDDRDPEMTASIENH